MLNEIIKFFMNSLSKLEEKKLITLLNKLKPGFLPEDIFFALTSLVVSSTYTIVPLFYNGKIKVHLTAREKKDPQWSGLLQTPGKVILPTDKTIEDAHMRLKRTEMAGLKIKKGPIFCGYVFDEIPRGKEVALINFVLLKDKPNFGKLYNVTNLPKNLIPSEIKRIKMAVRHYKLMKKNKKF